MSSVLLFFAAAAHATTEAAANGEAASGITKITQDFGISTPFLIAQIINFSVVAFILWKLAFKPVMATLDARQQKIASGLKYAEDMQAKLAATQQESAAAIKQAQAEGARLIEEA